MQFLPLPSNEESGATHLAIITHEDLTEAATGTAQTIALCSVEDKMGVECVQTVLKTAFEDASDAAFNDIQVQVGDGGDTDRFLAAQQVNVNGTEVNQKFGTGTRYNYPSADTVDLTVGSQTGKSLSDVDAGELHVYLRILDER